MDKKTITRILALILAAVLALGCFLLPVLAAEPAVGESEPASEAEAITTIGGADGPTAIFVTGGFNSRTVVGSVLILIIVAGLVLSRKRAS